MTFALLRAESLMFKFPVRNPVAAGAKITPMVQLSPVSSVWAGVGFGEVYRVRAGDCDAGDL
jgi:hypothetical protein